MSASIAALEMLVGACGKEVWVEEKNGIAERSGNVLDRALIERPQELVKYIGSKGFDLKGVRRILVSRVASSRTREVLMQDAMHHLMDDQASVEIMPGDFGIGSALDQRWNSRFLV